LNEHHLPEQKDGTARPSLALENLQHIENMRGSQRDNAEAALRGVLGSMYTGERPLHGSDFHWHRLKAFVFSPEICPLLRKAGSDSVRETYTDHATAHTPDVSHILVSECSDDNCVLPHPRFVPGSPEACPEGVRCGHRRLAPPRLQRSSTPAIY